MIDLLLLALGLVVMLLAGELVVEAVRPALAERAAGRIGLALVIGPGCVAFPLLVLLALGVPIGSGAAWSIAVVVTGAWLLRRGRRPRLRAAADERLPGGAAVLLALPVVVGALLALTIPPFKDALSIWSLKAWVLFHDGAFTTAEFGDARRFHFHPNYPLLLPLAEVFLFGIRGEAIDVTAKVVLAFSHLGIVLVVFAHFEPRLGRVPAILLAALVSATPQFYRSDESLSFAGSVPSGYADPLLAALVGSAAIVAIDWIAVRRARDAAAAGLLLGLAVCTKNEGLALTAVFLAALGLAVAIDRRGGATRRGILAGAGVLVAIALPWLLARRGLLVADENYLGRLRYEVVVDSMWRVKIILVSWLAEALAVDRQGLAWVLAPFALVGGRRRLTTGPVLFLALVVAGGLAVYGVVFLVSPLLTLDQIRSALPRTLFHLAPLAVVLVGTIYSPRT